MTEPEAFAKHCGEAQLALVETLLNSVNPKQKLNDLQLTIFLGTWKGLSYAEIAEQLDYQRNYDYIKQAASQLWKNLSKAVGEPVTKRNLQAVLRRYQQSQQTKQDWGEAIDVSRFYGREDDLQTLETWILSDDCRVIGIFGLGGIGKTTLSVKLAQQIQSQFDCVIWRSLQQAPPLNTLLGEILPILAGSTSTGDSSINTLMKELHSKRCLLVLDNVESILQDGNRGGQYQPGYEAYRQLFTRICDEPHQSCLLITGRDKPNGFAIKEGKNLPVRSLQLNGLSGADGQQLLIDKGLEATISQHRNIVRYFGGNPLALKIAATSIQTIFGGNVSAFLEQGNTVFSDLWDLIEQQFKRLSPLQQQIMYWLAINREGVTPTKLQEEILPKVSWRELLEALESLKGRSLIEDERALAETTYTGLTLQPVIMEYVTEKFIEAIEQEIIHLDLNLFKTYALIEAQTQDYLRDAQIQLILHPLCERLLAYFETSAKLEMHLCKILFSFKHQTAAYTGYAVGNLLNLFCHLKTDFTGFDFSNLVIRQAYLVNETLHEVDFSNSQISQTFFAETFGGVLGLAYSPDGQFLATSDTTGDIHIWDICTGKQLVRCRGHKHWTWAIAFSPNGRYLASGGDDYLVKLWDVETGHCLRTYQGHTYTVNCVTFSPDGKILASSSQDATICLWEVDPIGNMTSPPTPLLVGEGSNTSFFPPLVGEGREGSDFLGQLIAPQEEGSKTSFLPPFVGEGREGSDFLGQLIGHQGRVWSIAISSDGKTLASGGEDCKIRLWDIATRNCREEWLAHKNWVRSVTFSSDSQILASSSYDHTIKLWHIKTKQCLKILQGHRQAVTSISFSPDNKKLASSSFDRTVKLWEVMTGECLKTFLGHTNRVWNVAFHPQGQQIASGGDDHATKLWNLKLGRCQKTFKGHTNAVISLSLSPDGNYFASGHEDQTVRLWDIKKSTLIQTFRGHNNRVWSVAFQPATSDSPLIKEGRGGISKGDERELFQEEKNGKILASGSGDYTIKLWDLQLGKCLQTLCGHTSWVWSIAFHLSGTKLISASYDQTVKLWDINTGECLKTFHEHSSPVICVVYSPDSKLIASSDFDGIIKLRDAETGECYQTFKEHTKGVWSVTFSPNGKWLLSASFDQTLKLWDVFTGECLQTFQGHQDGVVVGRFSPDNQFIISGGWDRNLKLWDIRTGECYQTLVGHTELIDSLLVASVKFGEQASATLTAVSGSLDESIKFWDLQANKCWQTLRVPRPYEGMKIKNIQGLTNAQETTLNVLGAAS